MSTARTIDWEIANLEGGLFQPGVWTGSDTLNPIRVPPEIERSPAAPTSSLRWRPVLAAAVVGGAFLGSVVAMASPQRTTPRLRAPAAVPTMSSEATAPPVKRAPIAFRSEAAPVDACFAVEAPVLAYPAIEGAAVAAPAKSPEERSASALRDLRAQVLPATRSASVMTSPRDAEVTSKLGALVARPRDINGAEAAVVIAAAGRRAASCADPDGDRVSMPVSVTFASSGHVTSARIDGGPFVSTATGGCIARSLRGITVHAFDGDPITLHGTIRVP
jgi:hypothetical protein